MQPLVWLRCGGSLEIIEGLVTHIATNRSLSVMWGSENSQLEACRQVHNMPFYQKCFVAKSSLSVKSSISPLLHSPVIFPPVSIPVPSTEIMTKPEDISTKTHILTPIRMCYGAAPRA